MFVDLLKEKKSFCVNVERKKEKIKLINLKIIKRITETKGLKL